MRVSGHRDHTLNFGLDPGHRVQVQDVDVVEALISIVPSKHVELATHPAHRVAGSR